MEDVKATSLAETTKRMIIGRKGQMTDFYSILNFKANLFHPLLRELVK